MRQLLPAVLLVALQATAQSPADARPPACPGGARTPSHPSASALMQTEQKAADDPSVLLSPEPVGNMGLLRYRVRDYVDCAAADGPCYWADLDAQTRRAEAVLRDAVRSAPKGAKLALVLDIDETSLTNYCEEIREDFGFLVDRFQNWIVTEEAATPVPGTLRLARAAQAQGVSLFFITGRPESQRAATERNLAAAGFRNWQHLSMRRPDQATTPTVQYKSAERREIVAAGYTVVLNVGDQWSDLAGEPMAAHSVKLPNPFYYIP